MSAGRLTTLGALPGHSSILHGPTGSNVRRQTAASAFSAGTTRSSLPVFTRSDLPTA
ncbi:hypothetical protein ACT1U9_26315 [Streptomyces sp. BR1]|uniref:hypothetical protein n=1 Tax=Streptomyces sp. BR1 TaxID=1592323 RepID=UPI00402BA0C6